MSKNLNIKIYTKNNNSNVQQISFSDIESLQKYFHQQLLMMEQIISEKDQEIVNLYSQLEEITKINQGLQNEKSNFKSELISLSTRKFTFVPQKSQNVFIKGISMKNKYFTEYINQSLNSLKEQKASYIQYISFPNSINKNIFYKNYFNKNDIKNNEINNDDINVYDSNEIICNRNICNVNKSQKICIINGITLSSYDFFIKCKNLMNSVDYEELMNLVRLCNSNQLTREEAVHQILNLLYDKFPDLAKEFTYLFL